MASIGFPDWPVHRAAQNLASMVRSQQAQAQPGRVGTVPLRTLVVTQDAKVCSERLVQAQEPVCCVLGGGGSSPSKTMT
jgi:hypothetical protein